MPAMWTALSASARGALHESMGKINQDAVSLRRPKCAADSLVVAVADGHGSSRSFRSDRGAYLATQCALRLLRNFERKTRPRKGRKRIPLSNVRRQMEKRFPRMLTTAWSRAVREDLAANPFTALDFAAFPDRVPVLHGNDLPFAGYLAYGATMVIAAITPRYFLYAQLGDGDILIVHSNGTVSRPWPREHAFFSTETVSLCSLHAVDEFKVKLQPRRGGEPALILVSTDGYSNCFADDSGFFKVGSEFLSYLRAGGLSFVSSRLEQWLSDSSRDGSRDDITVGLAVRLSALRTPLPGFAGDAEEEEPENMDDPIIEDQESA